MLWYWTKSNATEFYLWPGHQFLAGTWSCSRNNCHLFLSSTLAQVGGQHYVLRSWHKKAIPKDCLAVDGLVNPNLDIVVNVAPIGKCMCRKSLVRIRYILLPTTQDSLCEGKSKQPFLVEDLCIITLHNMVRKLNCKGTARANGGEVSGGIVAQYNVMVVSSLSPRINRPKTVFEVIAEMWNSCTYTIF